MTVQDQGRQRFHGGVEAGFAAARAGGLPDLRDATDDTPVCGTHAHRCRRQDGWLQAMLGPRSGLHDADACNDEDTPVCGSCGRCARHDDAWLGRLLH